MRFKRRGKKDPTEACDWTRVGDYFVESEIYSVSNIRSLCHVIIC